jgi:hypothetical protein
MAIKAFSELTVWTEFIHKGIIYTKTSGTLAAESSGDRTIYRFDPAAKVNCPDFVPNIKRHTRFVAYLKEPADLDTKLIISVTSDGTLKSDQLIFKNE